MEKAVFRVTMSRVGMGYFLMLFLAQLGQGIFALVFPPALLANSWGVWLLTDIPLYGIAVPAFLFWMRRCVPDACGALPRRRLPARVWPRLFLLAMGCVYLLNFVSLGISALIGLLRGRPVANPLAETVSAAGIWANLLFGCVVAPVGEEYLFRGVLYRKIGAYGDKWYIFISGLIFALFHANLSQMLYAFALGMLLAYVYVRTGSLLYPVALHMAVNFPGMVLATALVSSQAGSMALSVFVLVCCVCAPVIALRARRGLVLRAGTLGLVAHPVRTAFATWGMAFYTVLCLALAALVALVL